MRIETYGNYSFVFLAGNEREDGGYVVMADETKIPISRRRKDDFITAIKRYLPAIS